MSTGYVFFRYLRLQNDLAELKKEFMKFDERAIRALRIIKGFYLDFREHFRLHDFETKAEELFFFKIIKPDVMSHRIYYMELFNWWKGRPKEVGGAARKVYWTDKLLMTRTYCEKYKHVLKTWEEDLQKLGKELYATENNGLFELRGVSNPEVGAVHAEESTFSYGHGDIAARVLAYSRLSRFCLMNLRLSEVLGAHGGATAANPESEGRERDFN